MFLTRGRLHELSLNFKYYQENIVLIINDLTKKTLNLKHETKL